MHARTLARGAALSLLTLMPLVAAAQMTLRLGTDQPVGHPYNLAAERFAEAVSERTDGEVAVKVYPGAVLGDTPDQMSGLNIGTLDMTLAAYSHASQFCPELALFTAPYLFNGPEDFAAVFDGPVADQLDEACNKRFGIHLLATFTSGFRNVFNSERPVNSPSDLHGMKIRVMSGDADALTWKTFGAIPAPIAYSELYSALQSGVVDAAENEPASMLDNRFYETAPYISLTGHLVLPLGLFIGDLAWNKVPAEYHDDIRKAARDAQHWEWGYMEETNAKALETMQAKYGVKVNEVADEQAFIDRGKKVQEQVAQRLGAMELLAAIRKSVGDADTAQ